ncbi:MAG: hypothetical protein PF518_10945 [Spirochaetaceae bacterium]|jgi:hypothetical protein|nr:hypothetical protein [Spirochaetaceae bacterium]
MYNRNNSTLHATRRCGPGRVFFFINIQRVVTKESCLSLNPHPRPFSQREKGETYHDSYRVIIAKQVVAQLVTQLVSLFADLQENRKIGIVRLEIPFNRHFYIYQPQRNLTEIDAELDQVSTEIMELLKEVHS